MRNHEHVCYTIETAERSDGVTFEVKHPLSDCPYRSRPPEVTGYFARPLWRHPGRRIYLWQCCCCLTMDIGDSRVELTRTAERHFAEGCGPL